MSSMEGFEHEDNSVVDLQVTVSDESDSQIHCLIHRCVGSGDRYC